MLATDEVKLRLFRYDPSVDEVPRYEDFTVPYKPYMRVVDVLNYVYDELEIGLAHRWYCGVKRCGECAVTVNGEPLLGCWEPAVEKMTVEPLANFPIIRDLVVDAAPYEQTIMDLQPYLERAHHPEFPEKIGRAEMEQVNRLYKCIECNVCSAAIPVKRISEEGIDWQGYAGPAALVKFARFVLDPRDETDRRDLATRSGLGQFPLFAALEDVCPQGIDIVQEALVPSRRKLLGIDEATIDRTATTTAFVMARQWSAFLRLAEDQKRELQEAGVIKTETIPDLAEAYRLVES